MPNAKFFHFLAVVSISLATGLQAHTVRDWVASPADGNWNNAANWSLTGPPVVNQRARFGFSSITTIDIPTAATINRMIFTAGAPGYTFSGATLTFELNSPLEATDAIVMDASSGNATIGNAVGFQTIDAAITNAPLKVASGSVLTFNGPVTTTALGILLSDAGRVQFNGAVAISGGSVTVSGGGILGGSGSFTGPANFTIQNGAFLKPGGTGADTTGTLSINAPLSLSNTSTVEFGLGGTAPGDFDRLVNITALTLDGTFSIAAVDGFATTSLVAGATFDLMDWTGSTTNAGFNVDFSNAPLAAGLSWDASSFASDGVIAVVPEPQAWQLLALVALFCVMRRLPFASRTS